MIAGVPYTVAIVEDDDKQANILQHMILRCRNDSEIEIVRFSSFDDLEKRASRIDIALMDIRLGDESRTGIDAAATMFPQGSGTQVIYVTGYPEYCTEVYQTEHIYFLTKPVMQADLNNALGKAIERIRCDGERPLGISSGNRLVRVLPRKISYIESDRRKVRVHLADSAVLETYHSMKALAPLLPSSFVRCHKSFLVNMAFIDELQSDAVCMLSGELVPMSRTSRRQVRERFASYLRARL